MHDGNCAPVPDDGSCRGLGTEKIDPCDTNGRCTPIDGLCLATETKHCANVMSCTDEGTCQVIDGVCAPGGDEGTCRESDACRTRGLCGSEGGRCVAASDEDCAASSGCADYGACRKVGRECRAGTEDHCRAAQACRDAYRCTYEHGYCWASAADCARAKECDGGCPHLRGECVLPPAPIIDFQF